MSHVINASSDRRGSLWNRWDLHFHTPSSFDYKNKEAGDAEIVERLINEGVRVVAITDHHRLDIARISRLQELAKDRLTIFPGIELRSELGSKPVHYICIFPEDCDLDYLWTRIQGVLKLSPADIQAQGGDENIYVPIASGANLARELGGVISIHAGEKSNSIEGIRNREQFQQRIKYNVTRDYVDLMEVGQIKDVESHWKLIFPAIGLERPVIVGSDNHDIRKYSLDPPLWLRADPTFRGLLMVLREPRDRVFIGGRPDELGRAEKSPTKFIKEVRFERTPDAPASERWFSGNVAFSHGLVAIVGNKGSGKSALADVLGLLGASKNSAYFSFLNKERFRHPTEGRAQFFDAVLTWESGDQVRRSLSEVIKDEEVERIKYLPQDHIETICNELAEVGGGEFEQELKSVIFSHVPEARRIGFSTFDELVRFQSSEKESRIDSLLRQLRELSRDRALLEAKTDPVVRQRLARQIGQRKLELEAHVKKRPAGVPDPNVAGIKSDQSFVDALTSAGITRKELQDKIFDAEEDLRTFERRHAVAKLLIERLDNFRKDFEVFADSLASDANELGLSVPELASLKIDTSAPSRILGEAVTARLAANDRINGESGEEGLRWHLAQIEKKIVDLQGKLDAPSRAFQAYLASLSEWESEREAIEGGVDNPESLRGLEAALAALERLPEELALVKKSQLSIALQIHAEKCSQAEIYRALYGPIQEFIDNHWLARNRLELEFRVELATDDFPGRLLSLVAQSKRGSFMGIEEGRARAETFVQVTSWADPASVENFLDGVDKALHGYERGGENVEVLLRDQLIKNRKPEEVFDLIYGLDYVRPRYILRWAGKDLAMLSPGERGTLLLVFYLLIDKSDCPLIIDQPEGNLDNHTVAKVLIDCIKDARQRRQVFIVTHNPNLAVVCDADQVIYASMDKNNGNAVTYKSGSLENPQMSLYVTDVLEGTRWAFGVRDGKYKIGDMGSNMRTDAQLELSGNIYVDD